MCWSAYAQVYMVNLSTFLWSMYVRIVLCTVRGTMASELILRSVFHCVGIGGLCFSTRGTSIPTCLNMCAHAVLCECLGSIAP